MSDQVKPTEDGKPSPEDEGRMDEFMKKYRQYACQRYNLIDKPTEEKKPDEAIRLERDQLAIQYAQTKASVDTLSTEVATLRRDRDRAVCERMVQQLVAERYQLNAVEEVEELLSRPADKRDAYLQRVRKNYTRVPGGETVPVQYEGEPPVGVPAETAAQHQAAVDYMRAHPGMTLEAAYVACTPKK